MAYEDVANLAADADFGRRLTAALTTEAAAKVGDSLADQILKSPGVGMTMFMPLVSSAPGFGAKYASGGQAAVTDGDLLAAVQASWVRVQGLYSSTIDPGP